VLTDMHTLYMPSPGLFLQPLVGAFLCPQHIWVTAVLTVMQHIQCIGTYSVLDGCYSNSYKGTPPPPHSQRRGLSAATDLPNRRWVVGQATALSPAHNKSRPGLLRPPQRSPSLFALSPSPLFLVGKERKRSKDTTQHPPTGREARYITALQLYRIGDNTYSTGARDRIDRIESDASIHCIHFFQGPGYSLLYQYLTATRLGFETKHTATSTVASKHRRETSTLVPTTITTTTPTNKLLKIQLWD